MTPKQRNAAYNRDLDSAFQRWLRMNPNATDEEKCRWTFAGYDAWYAGYRAAMRQHRRSP